MVASKKSESDAYVRAKNFQRAPLRHALLFDTRSIQHYIYSGDKLRTNIGASYIVDRLFYDVLIGGVLSEMFANDRFDDDTTWDVQDDRATPWQNIYEMRVKKYFSDQANDKLKSRFDRIFKLKRSTIEIADYEFPLELDRLGQIRDQNNYIAIVHVDGNNMGKKFREGGKTLAERRLLSREIKRKTEGAFADLLIKIIEMIRADRFGKTLELDQSLEQSTLPIRPLIIGGDDITFVCPANMALMFTKTLTESLSRETPLDAPEHLTSEYSRRMDCCAGISILSTAYPFFRGYTLTEQLCDAAKRSMRQSEEEGTSWLDFAILHGEQAPTLDQIRAEEYLGERGELHFGPYRVGNPNDDRFNVENLLECTARFKDERNRSIAKNKIKELRSVLQHGEEDAARFFQQSAYQKQSLPKIAAWQLYAEQNGWVKGRTPYIDAIELTDFYEPEVAKAWQTLQ